MSAASVINSRLPSRHARVHDQLVDVDGNVPWLCYEAMRQEVAQCARIDEAAAIRDKAAALAAYARQRDDAEMAVWTAEIKLRASIRIGELLKECCSKPLNVGNGVVLVIRLLSPGCACKITTSRTKSWTRKLITLYSLVGDWRVVSRRDKFGASSLVQLGRVARWLNVGIFFLPFVERNSEQAM